MKPKRIAGFAILATVGAVFFAVVGSAVGWWQVFAFVGFGVGMAALIVVGLDWAMGE